MSKKYSNVNRPEITKYRRLLAQDLSDSTVSVAGYLREVKGQVPEYKDFLDIASYALKNNSKFNDYIFFSKAEFEKVFPYQDFVLNLYVDSLLFGGEKDIACSVIYENFPKMKDAWLKLELVENLCDYHLWSVVDDVFKCLTWSGTAAKLKYSNIEKRVRLSLKSSERLSTPVLYINLDKDIDKNARVDKSISLIYKEKIRVPGVLAKNLPDYVLSRVNRSETLKSQVGAIGCFLGHVNALETIVKRKLSYALILEDDAFFYYRPSRFDMEEILKNEFDVLYVNCKMMARSGGVSKGLFSSDFIGNRLAEFPDKISGWGAYGYIVTFEGAKKLLENIRFDGVLGHYDGQLGSYGLSVDDFSPASKAQRTGMSFARKFSDKSSFLNIKCLDFPLVSFKDFGKSSRNENS